MKQYAKEILINLIDKYERSKVSDGNNQIRVSVKLATEKIFPKYLDNELFELREKVNEAIEELISKCWIVAKRSSNYTYSNITLPQKENVLSQIYLFLGREKKSDRRQKLTKLFTTFMSDGDETVEKYCKKQLENLEQNKAVEFFNGDYEELKSVLECCIALKKLPQEMYYRNFSVKQFGDSKKFEILQGKIGSLLFKYGNFSEKESVFDELGLLKTPSYIHIKGNVSIFWKDGKCLDAAGLDGGVGISTTDVKKIVSVKIQDEKIVTIENLTSFFSFSEPNVCAVYLGGFCNHLRREFLMKVYGAEPAKKYFHYGDIDAGGFYIFEHLRTTTGIPFAPLMMNVDTLRKYKPYWKELTKNDVSRLQKIRSPIFQEVIAFMLKENCKLEQEAETLGGE